MSGIYGGDMITIRQMHVFCTVSIVLLVYTELHLSHGDTGANIPSYTVISQENIPASRGTQGRLLWCNNVLVNWMEIKPDDGVPLEQLPGDRIILVRKGTVKLTVDNRQILLKEHEIIRLDGGSKFALSPAGMVAEFFEIYWPVNGLNHSHNEVQFPVGGMTYYQMFAQWQLASMMRPWEKMPPSFGENTLLPPKELTHCRPVPIESLQYCHLDGGPHCRIFQSSAGLVCLYNLTPGGQVTGTNYGEQFQIVLHGLIEETIADSTVVLEENDVIYHSEPATVTYKTDENGCEILAVFPSSPSGLIQVLNNRLERYYTLIPRDAEPVLLYDGVIQEPGLTFTEGPCWLNGHLYFTNTHMFSSRPGDRSQGGFYVLNQSGSTQILNYDIHPVGTFPLTNGNIVATDFGNHAIVELAQDGTLLRVITNSFEGKSLGGPNDLVVDRKGGIYFTDPWGNMLGEVPGTAVYYIRPTGETIQLTDWNEYKFPNGCILSPDGSQFYLNAPPGMSGHGKPEIWVYDVNNDGMIVNKRHFATIIFGRTADGITIDTHGNLYVATGTGGVQIFDPVGDFIGHIHFPKQAQNCVFGGDDLSTLYVTCRSQIYSIETNSKGYRYPTQ